MTSSQARLEIGHLAYELLKLIDIFLVRKPLIIGSRPEQKYPHCGYTAKFDGYAQ